MFIKDAFAQASTGLSAGGLGEVFLQVGLIFAIFYILVIIPQNKKAKQYDAMLKSIKKGDKILTSGGIYGKVVNDGEAELDVEIAHGVVVKVSRMTVRDVVSDKIVPANSNKKDKK